MAQLLEWKHVFFWPLLLTSGGMDACRGVTHGSRHGFTVERSAASGPVSTEPKSGQAPTQLNFKSTCPCTMYMPQMLTFGQAVNVQQKY